MKPLKSKKIIIFSLFISLISCKAQEYPLNTDFRNVPDYSYLKDINNELDSYMGNYYATFNGNQITLFITKEDDTLVNYGNQKFYRDALVVKYIVKNSVGTILQDTKNNNLPKIYMYSTKIRSTDNAALLTYSGTNCRVGWGDIILKKISTTQLSWGYRPDDIILDSSRCPSGTDINIYLPETKDLIFTKQ